MQHPVLLDNTVLTNFALIARPDLPLKLWAGRACTTQEVMGEYQAGVREVGLPATIWDGLPIIQITNLERSWMADQLPDSLGSGERTCLAAAFYRQGIFASDDLQARKLAQALNLIVVGSTGILIECGRYKLLNLTQAQHLLNLLISAGYYAPVKDLSLYFGQ